MIQIYFYKKNFDAQKAERFFKERRVQVQMIDLSRVPIGRRELESVKARVGLDALIDRDGAAWKECPARFAAGEEAIFAAQEAFAPSQSIPELMASALTIVWAISS